MTLVIKLLLSKSIGGVFKSIYFYTLFLHFIIIYLYYVFAAELTKFGICPKPDTMKIITVSVWVVVLFVVWVISITTTTNNIITLYIQT